MADPQLTTADWKKFAKGRDLKDAAVLKALDALGDADPDGQRQALDALEKQLDLLAKAHKADKSVTDHLGALDKALKVRRKQAEAALLAEEDESPALLTSKMVPVLRQVAGGAVVQACLALLSKQAVVLVSKRAAGPTQRKLMTTELGTTAGVKFLHGQCLFEKNAHTFVLEAKTGGLAKRLKLALQAQTGLRLKVRVRGPDPDDVDEDLDDSADAAEQATRDTPAARSANPDADDTSAAPAPLLTRMGEARARVQQAVRDQHPQATKLNTLLAFAAGKMDRGEFTAAEQALAALAPMLAGLAAGTDTATRSRTGAVNYAKARLAWLAARKKAHGEIQQLQQAIRSALGPDALEDDDDPEDGGDGSENDAAPDEDVPTNFPDLEERLQHLDGILLRLDESLADTLDAALNAADPDRRETLHQQAQAQIADFLGYVESEPLLLNLDQNPFVPVTVQATLQATLRTLAATLKV